MIVYGSDKNLLKYKIKMSTSKNYPTQQGFISYRTNVSKVASSSPNAIQTNQNHSFIMSTQKGKNTSHNS